MSEPAPVAARSDQIARWLGERDLDALLVTQPANVRYLTGFTGDNGLVVVGSTDLAMRLFVTDFRYVTQASGQVHSSYQHEVASTELVDSLGRHLVPARFARTHLRLGFDDASLSVKQHGRLAGIVPQGIELVPAGGLVERMRSTKDPEEVARIRAAAALADEVLSWVLEMGLTGRTERQVAIALETELRVRGATAPSFPSIVAAGEHSALPHAEPRDVAISADMLVTLDFGAVLDGYCSDCTRTVATGDVGDEARAVYGLVAEAQLAGLEALRPGRLGREVDAVARELITAAGHGDHFGHGLGHGVGLEVHELPRLSRTAGNVALEAGNVVTVEPGVYIPGRFGVRIEDLTVVTDEGCELLTGLSKELLTVA